MKKLVSAFMAAFVMVLMGGYQALHAAPLANSTVYTITISKIGSDGTPVVLNTTTATTNGSGKLTFNLTNIPTKDVTNFILFEVKDSTGTAVRKGLVPAPPANDKNLVGINDMSHRQTAALLQMLSIAQSDDPILLSYGLALLRSSQLDLSVDPPLLGNLGKLAIRASGNATTPSFEEYLADPTKGNVPAAKIAAFKQCLVFNNLSSSAGRAKTIRDFSRGFYDANEQTSSTESNKEMQKVGGLMADIFMDAGLCAGIDAGKILAAHDAAGDVANPYVQTGAGAGMTAPVKQSMNQSMSAFYQRIAMARLSGEYTKALLALGASGTDVDSFMNAVKTMQQTNAAIEAQFGGFFDNPTVLPYTDSLGNTYATAALVQTAIDTAHGTAFSQFQTNIQSSATSITAMKAKVQLAFPGLTLPSDFGTYRDFTNPTLTKNWPIPQTVMVTWMADRIIAGGSLTYTRDTTTIPTFMGEWMGTCSNTMYNNRTGCTAGGATWTVGRHDFSFIPTQALAFRRLLEMQEDVQIVEQARYALWQAGGTITKAQERDAKTTFENNMSAIEGRIGGTKNSTGTLLSDSEKEAIIKVIMQPSMD